MSGRVIGTRRFGASDLAAFAELSGDFNPVHLDPIAARRTMFGGQIVHGVFSMLDALDQALAGERMGTAMMLGAIRASFKRPLRLDETMVVRRRSAPDDDRFQLLLEAGEQTVATIEGTLLVPSSAPYSRGLDTRPFEPRPPARSTFEVAARAHGATELRLDPALVERLFPALDRALDRVQLAELLATTRIIGMECPGENSLYASLDLSLSPERQIDNRMAYQVAHADARVSLIDLSVKGPMLLGKLRAFIRPEPEAQPSLERIRASVGAGQFAGRRALVIGGTRGLGEVTAKIIAAGGGEVTLTYQSGKEDAARVVAELRASGARAEAIALDVLEPPSAEALRGSLGAMRPPTHLYYFATPHIPMEKERTFSRAAFETLSRYYAGAFAELVLLVRKTTDGPLVVFYPSTVFLDEMPKGAIEYCAAKAAGEMACRMLERSMSATRFVVPRLPRMKTDQTAGILPVKAADTVATMLEALR